MATKTVTRAVWCACLFVACCGCSAADGVHHYAFFNRDRERIHDAAFLGIESLEGAQLKYTWRQLEPDKDVYDFSAIQDDLAFLSSKGKGLFLQLQDASFDVRIKPIPNYLIRDVAYHGGADPQYKIEGDDEEHATREGWVARRWDPGVQERFHQLLGALGRQFDGKIEGINLAETAVDFGESGRLFPKGFTPDVYCDAVVANMTALKRAFPRSVAMQYANFMPGGDRYLRAVYARAKELKVGVGGPDLLRYQPYQMANSYQLIRECAGIIPTGIAVQEGNYDHEDPVTGQRVTIAGLVRFATEYLKVGYIFGFNEEPYYTEKVLPFLQARR
jgi:hypothetical protein